ncbi:MAG: family 43 glycosylhydrolase [Candidatus Aminicenantes bacterium]|nr:family 43 glycosylhydrolase [Candidatus Aminicenantes bacterium]
MSHGARRGLIGRVGLLLSAGLVFPGLLRSQNPITPAGFYTADPSAHVWRDGRIYVYVSRDESPKYYCSWDYPVLSSDDLLNWRIDTNVFASRGSADRVPYSDAALYAPDCQYRNGVYHLFYCLSGGGEDEGVAISGSPLGPFLDARPIQGISQIDPCCFIDDDGRAYLVWGQFTCKIAALSPDLRSVEPSTIREIAFEKEHFFHEGAFMFKRKGLYYLLYADISRRNSPTCLGYATSPSPWGPFHYRGVVIDNAGSDPMVWNNHGSIAEFKGRWYVFYHRSTHGSKMMRKTCVEPISFTPDGLIPEVEMTSQGAAPPLDAYSRLEAERACLLSGNVRIRSDSAAGSEILAKIENGNSAAFKSIDFGAGAKACSIRLAGGGGGRITVRLDRPWGPAVAAVDTSAGGDDASWRTLSGTVKEVRGVHAVWLQFTVPEDRFLEVDWLVFERKSP